MKEYVTYLFVPTNKKELFSKALECGADAIIIDLHEFRTNLIWVR